jgi:hypothetical protein
MITFQELKLSTSLSFDALNQAIIQQLTGGWIIGDIRTGSNNAENWHQDSSCYSYSCERKDGRFAAALFLAASSDGGFYVSNICPAQDSPNRLGYDLYNVILNDFHRQILRPLEIQGALKASPSSADYKIEEHLSAEAYKCLSVFAESANKGIRHPSDLEWWLGFLIAVHSQPERPDSEILGRWFTEEAGWQGWPEEVSALQSEYEFAMSLLSRSLDKHS